MYKRIISAALVFGAAALAPPLQAQGNGCMQRDVLVQRLAEDYKEQMTGAGLQNPQQLLEVWSADQTGSFTVFVTRPDGHSCVLATGRYWNSMTAPSTGDVAG